MTNLLSSVTNFIVSIISVSGYVGVAGLMALQTVAVPIPSEVILPFAGFLVFTGRFNLFILALVGGIGSCIGSSIAYYIGFKGGRPLVEKYGRYILISASDLSHTESFFARFGSIAVFVGQLLPVVRSFIGFAAGIAKENLKKFVVSVFVGSFLWSLLLGFVGMKLGQNWESLHARFQKFDVVIVVLIVVGVGLWVWKHVRASRSANKQIS